MSLSRNKAVAGVALAIRIVLGAIFVYAGYVKLRDPWQVFAMAIDNYHLVPFQYLHALSLAIPWFEVVVGLLLCFGRFLRLSSSAVSLLLCFFFVLMLRAFINHQEIDCGCFGSGGGPISKWTLLRDGSMLAGSLFVTWMALRNPRRTA
jgi:uncharacterized membrane protein YphA (DoxX/SURF4 family)